MRTRPRSNARPDDGVDPGGGGSLDKTPAKKRFDRWKYCLDKYGTENAKAHLTEDQFNDAETAAQAARIPTKDLLSLWDNESSFDPKNYKAKPAGDVGPLQVTPSAAGDLNRVGRLPKNYKTDVNANILAGA